MSLNQDNHHMQLALTQAKQAEVLGEVPVGAVLVCGGQVIARGYNQPISQCDATAHAEIVVLRAAGRVLKNYRLIDSTLYVTLEPCAMCLAAMVHARVSRLVFGAGDKKTGACGGCLYLVDSICFNHKIKIVSGIMQTQCSQMLANFFKNKRKNAMTLK